MEIKVWTAHAKIPEQKGEILQQKRRMGLDIQVVHDWNWQVKEINCIYELKEC